MDDDAAKLERIRVATEHKAHRAELFVAAAREILMPALVEAIWTRARAMFSDEESKGRERARVLDEIIRGVSDGS